MKCPHCEYERSEAFAFCPKCGKPSTRDPESVVVCPTPRILAFIKNDLFLVICILLTVSVATSLFSGGFNIINILITIFAWLTYAGGRKNVVEHNHIRVISGSIYAMYVINNVAAIIMAVTGAIYSVTMLGLPFLSGINIEKIITEEIGPMITVSAAVLALISAMAMFLGLFLIVIAIIMLILNVAGLKKIHLFIQSLYKSAEAGEENLVGANKVQPWIIIFAVITVLSALSSISSGELMEFLSNGIFAAALIIFSVLIGKHFCDK